MDLQYMRQERIESQCESFNSGLIATLFQRPSPSPERTPDKCHFVPMPQCSFTTLQSNWLQPTLMRVFIKKRKCKKQRSSDRSDSWPFYAARESVAYMSGNDQMTSEGLIKCHQTEGPSSIIYVELWHFHKPF